MLKLTFSPQRKDKDRAKHSRDDASLFRCLAVSQRSDNCSLLLSQLCEVVCARYLLFGNCLGITPCTTADLETRG